MGRGEGEILAGKRGQVCCLRACRDQSGHLELVISCMMYDVYLRLLIMLLFGFAFLFHNRPFNSNELKKRKFMFSNILKVLNFQFSST